MSDTKLRIMAWNLTSIGPQKKKERIVEIIKDQKADVVILTEVKNTYRDMMKTLAKLEIMDTFKYTAIASNSALNYNNIVIAVLSRYVEGAIFEDYCIGGNYEKKVEIYKRRYEERNHPDRLLVRVRMKDSEEWLSILGIRMQNTGLSFVDKIEQVEALKWEIEAGEPDIVIGDFNWCSAFKDWNKKSFNDYSKWEEGDTISYIKGKAYSSPDGVLYNKKKYEDVSAHYLHEKEKKEEPSEFESDWPSDHDMLIVEVPID